MRHRRVSRTLGLLVSVGMCAIAVAGSGCSVTAVSTGPAATGSSPGSANLNPSTTTPSSFATIAELAKALNDKGIGCALSYPGLKDDASQAELSICTIDNEQAFLRVWQTAALVTKFLGSPDGKTGTIAAGANWTISFQTSATAKRVAASIGGSAP